MSANCLYKFSAIDHVASAADSLCLRSLISAVELVILDSILKIVSWLAVIVSVKDNTYLTDVNVPAMIANQETIFKMESKLTSSTADINDLKQRLSAAEATWSMAENLYRQLADTVRDHTYDLKDLTR